MNKKTIIGRKSSSIIILFIFGLIEIKNIYIFDIVKFMLDIVTKLLYYAIEVWTLDILKLLI